MTREVVLKYVKDANGWLNMIGLMGLIVSWIISFNIERVFLWTFFTTFLLDLFFFRGHIPLKADRTWLLYAVYLLFFLMVPVVQVCVGSSLEDILCVRSMEKHLPFVAFAIVGLFGFNEHIRLKYLAYLTVASAVLMLLYIAYRAGISNLFSAEDPIFLFEEARKNHFASHMMANVYFNIAILCAFYICTRKDIQVWIKWVFGLAGCFVAMGILLSEGRTGFVSCLVVLTILITYVFWQEFRLQYKSLLLFILLILLGAGLILHNERITEEKITHDPRMELWEIGVDMFLARPMGYGASEGRRQYVDRAFETMDVSFFRYQCPDPGDKYNLHVHNAWLEEAIGQGVIGAILLTLVLLLPCMVGEKKRVLYLGCVSIIMGAQYFFDVMDSVPYFVLALWTIVFLRAQWDK